MLGDPSQLEVASSLKEWKVASKGALEHLASIDLIELCNEAKIEHCRATRDLRSCGRNVQSVLNSCGHASLCEECSQRCDACPICRYPIPKTGNRVRLRLYYECIEAGLISKRCDDRFQEKDGEKQFTADVERLYSFFDVAMENNLISLICHYVTDVCMDESAVSSDPAVALLLDEVVVKDWCKRTFKNIVAALQGIYNLTVKDMKERLSSLFKFSARLGGISSVLEVLESSFKDSLSAQLQDMHQLQDSVLKTKQHLEMMIWCIRREFMENVKSGHRSFLSWRSVLRDRKTAAIKRSWPDPVNHPVKSGKQDGPRLFIEDALLNLDMDQGYTPEMGDGLEIAFLQKDEGSSFLRSKLEGVDVCYPFENLRSAIDFLFLCGSSDLVVAKQAIFLYYLFDRYWTTPEEEWRHDVDDFASTFSVTRHSILESLTFYLLDDHSNEALQEACRLLPEISGPTTHPKVAQVLLERQNPDAALMVLRWSGRDGGAELVSLGEAVTGVRVRVECGLLTEAYMYQRLLCSKVKEKKTIKELYPHVSNELKDEYQKWLETLVTEICILCIRRNLVDKIIELPWNSDEEKYLHKCLLDIALEDPSIIIGSLLVVFYLQRYRYMEAYQVDRKLQTAEQEFISVNSVSEEVLIKMSSASRWRKGLVEKSIQLLPDVQQQKVKTGKLPEVVSADDDNNSLATSDLPKGQEPIFTSLLVPLSVGHRVDNGIPSLKPSAPVTSLNGGSLSSSHFKSYASPAIPHVNVFKDAGGLNPLNSFSKDFRFDDIATSASSHIRPLGTSLKESNRSSSRIPQNSPLQSNWLNSSSPEKEQTSFISKFHSLGPYISRVATNPVTSLASSTGLFEDSPQGSYVNVSGKYVSSDRPGQARNAVASGDFMEISWSNGEERSSKQNANGRPRWRSDDVSDDEELQSPERLTGVASHSTPARGVRRSSRLAARR